MKVAVKTRGKNAKPVQREDSAHPSPNPLHNNPNKIVDRFFEVQDIWDDADKQNKMRGLKRAITLHCQKANNPDYARRWIKVRITKRGGDASLID